MKNNEFGAFILSETKNGERIVSCGGRISTRPGTAVDIKYMIPFDISTFSLIIG